MKLKNNIEGLDCLCAVREGSKNLAYILYPMDILEGWIEGASERYDTSIVVITGMDWDNVFSPWAAPGQPPGSPDFKGESRQFLNLLVQKIVPEIESKLGFDGSVTRTLVGVSMSGLFTLWQWMLCDTFFNIASLSGSFWFPGFLEWFEKQPVPKKGGEAYFLLGSDEPKSPVKAFQPVGRNTQQIVSRLKGAGLNVEYETVPGNHFADPLPRLDKAFALLK